MNFLIDVITLNNILRFCCNIRIKFFITRFQKYIFIASDSSRLPLKNRGIPPKKQPISTIFPCKGYIRVVEGSGKGGRNKNEEMAAGTSWRDLAKDSTKIPRGSEEGARRTTDCWLRSGQQSK